MITAAEEAMEVGHRISKALRFGLTEVQPGQPLTNAERIIDEFHDLFVMMEMLREEGHLPYTSFVPGIEKTDAKREKVNRLMDTISRREGTLDD
ncbi:hypothetical protein [Sphingomonas dokdonensis]|nr:hypothetical protein [Sphingomonas dokdonensis]